MTLSQTAQQLIAEAEALSGYPVAVVDDADLATPAALRMARGQSAMHLISLQAGASRAREAAGGGGREYHVCVQCGFILRFFASPPDERFDLTGSEAGRLALVELLTRMSRSGPLAGLPAAQLGTFADRLLMGLGMQLRSMPVELRINAWLAERHPELRAVQGVMARLQLQENAKALATRASVPAKVFRASIAMNAATALYWAGFLQDDSLAAPYRQAGYLIDGKALLKTWHALDASPEADRALIDAWATALNLRGWFQWLPYATPLGQARARAGEPD